MKTPLHLELEAAGAILLMIAAIGCGIVASLGFRPFARYPEKAMDAVLAEMLTHASALTFNVAKVVDGDTFVVRVNSGEATIRVLGINTPETVDPRKPVQCYGPQASGRAHALLEGRRVSLALDPTGALDKYGRVLAYVLLPDGSSFNKEMISEGYAFEYTYKKAYAMQKEFRAAQKEAKSAHVGVWSSDTCGGKLVPFDST